MSALAYVLAALVIAGIMMMTLRRLEAFLRGVQRGYRERRERRAPPRPITTAARTADRGRSPVLDAQDAARRFGPLNASQRRLVAIVFSPDERGATAPAIPHDDLARLLVSPTATRGASNEA